MISVFAPVADTILETNYSVEPGKTQKESKESENNKKNYDGKGTRYCFFHSICPLVAVNDNCVVVALML